MRRRLPRSTDSAPPVPTRFADIKPVAESSDIDASTVRAVLLSPDDTPTPDPEAFADVTASGGTGTNSDIAVRQPSIITRSAPAHLRELHDRVPLLVPAAFAHEWLAAPDASPALLDDVMLASDELVARVSAAPRR